jgi:hypothetical protein
LRITCKFCFYLDAGNKFLIREYLEAQLYTCKFNLSVNAGKKIPDIPAKMPKIIPAITNIQRMQVKSAILVWLARAKSHNQPS